MFRCGICTYSTEIFSKFSKHLKIHAGWNNKFICGYNRCQKIFRHEVSWRSHLSRSHNFQFKDRNSEVEVSTSRGDINGKFRCSEQTCKKELNCSYDLIKHMKSHIEDGYEIKCPLKGCKNPSYSKINSFSSHLTKCHKKSNYSSKNLNISELNISDQFIPLSDASDHMTADECHDENVENSAENNTELSCDALVTNLALFFLKLESKFCIPESTIQFIVTQLGILHELGVDRVKDNISPRLLEKGLSVDDTQNLLKKIIECNVFSQINELGTSYLRRVFYQKEFPYVEPVEIKLIEGNKKKMTKFFHYIPLIDTLRYFLSNKHLKNEIISNVEERKDNILKDFTDGSVYKQNKFFHENPKGLKLILYQDSFEVVNPLGAAKKKYKILAVYLNIGNLPDHLRSHVNTIQLVALCKEKDFNHEKVYGRIVRDLKKIETEGITLPSVDGVLKGTVVFIAGDNLGSNALGGYTENFSTAQYFCRYCLMTRREFYSDGGETKTYERRTPESYRKIIEQINKNSGTNSDDETPSIPLDAQGIKFDSAFNRLSHFHVADPGLPPCLGHDIFECLISYDVKLFLDKIIKVKKWFSYELLNNRIENFAYSNDDRRDKPCTISKKSDKITGGAWQLWTFLRLLPLLIYDKIIDVKDDHWKAIIILTEIIEIIIAPEIHTSCVPFLRLLIDEYISLRKQLPPPLRPKHHFLTHYPNLILQFGPLMKVWTLRFESKHMFFKKVVRNCKNFINITKSLSIKHELFQSYIRMGGEMRSSIDVRDGSHFCINHYNNQIQETVENRSLPGTSLEYSQITVKNVCYRRGDALIVSYEAYQYEVQVGRIIILLYDDKTDNIFFIVEVLETIFRPHFRTYELGKLLRYQCINLNELPSTEKLHIYNDGSVLCVKPNYGLVRKGL